MNLRPGDAWYLDILSLSLRKGDELDHIFVLLSTGSSVRLVPEVQYTKLPDNKVHIKVAPKEIQTLMLAEVIGLDYTYRNPWTGATGRVKTQHKPWYNSRPSKKD